jgi:hypothetical protein
MDGIPVGDWVALASDQSSVISHGPDFCAVISEANEKGEWHPFITGIAEPCDILAIFHDA